MSRFVLFLIFSMLGESAIAQDSVKVEMKFPELRIDNELQIFQEYFSSDIEQSKFNQNQIQQVILNNLYQQPQTRSGESNFESISWITNEKRNSDMIMSIVGDPTLENANQSPTEIFDVNLEDISGNPSKVLETVSAVQDKRLEDLTTRLFGPTKYDSRVQSRALNPNIPWQHKILEMTKSVGMVVEFTQLSQISDSIYLLEIVSTLSQKFQLCPGEAYENEPSVGVGTAFTVADSSMITAAHVFAGNPTNYAVVFGFEIINQNGVYNAFIPKENVYFVNAIEHKDLDLDLIQFRTDRVINRKPLDVDLDESSKVNDEICMIGHPMGLPQKVAVNASILSAEYPYHYFTSLDAFQGNSGSPVIHVESGKVIGVLVSGGSDYQWNGSCNKSVVCNYPNCMGERVAKLRTFLNEKTQ